MSQANAWLLNFGDSCRAAVGTRELLHLVDAPETFVVPCAPDYCNRVVLWQERLLPVMDMAARLGAASSHAPFLAVVAYQKARGEYPQFAALMLATPPQQLQVSDEQACPLPVQGNAWQELTISCFEHQGEPIPVLNLNLLFGGAPR